MELADIRPLFPLTLAYSILFANFATVVKFTAVKIK